MPEEMQQESEEENENEENDDAENEENDNKEKDDNDSNNDDNDNNNNDNNNNDNDEETKAARAEAEKLMDELYQLDYEDMIGSMPVRFHYTQVKPQSYGLSTEEIMDADDKELRQYVSIKKMAPYREREWYVPKNKAGKFKSQLQKKLKKMEEEEKKSRKEEKKNRKKEKKEMEKKAKQEQEQTKSTKRRRKSKKWVVCEQTRNRKQEGSASSFRLVLSSHRSIMSDGRISLPPLRQQAQGSIR